jgi:lipopolysaccharide biosynthesis glycosyltransferase
MNVFLGWDSRFPEPAQVLAHSILEHASIPVRIRYLDLRHLRECYGFKPQKDPRATTEFTYSRFLVPWLCGYTGTAVFMDNDMLCLGDIADLNRTLQSRMYNIADEPLALRVVQHDHQAVDGSLKMGGVVQTAYPRKNWSSLMLMNCAKLQCWTKEVVEEADGARLHRFADVPDNQIGDLSVYWNHLDTVSLHTKLSHWTSGGPWNDATREWPYQEVWLAARQRWLAATGQPLDTPVKSQILGL